MALSVLSLSPDPDLEAVLYFCEMKKRELMTLLMLGNILTAAQEQEAQAYPICASKVIQALHFNEIDLREASANLLLACRKYDSDNEGKFLKCVKDLESKVQVAILRSTSEVKPFFMFKEDQKGHLSVSYSVSLPDGPVVVKKIWATQVLDSLQPLSAYIAFETNIQKNYILQQPTELYELTDSIQFNMHENVI